MWRNASRISGTNADDLGAPRRWGNANNTIEAAPSRGFSQGSAQNESSAPAAPAEAGPRKRRSRWGDESAKVDLAGLPVAIQGNIEGKELDNYALSLRLEEINRKLRSGDVVPPERERSASPPPSYDAHGRRTNTREVRYRKKLEDERNKVIDRQMKSDPNFRPPPDFLMQKRGGRPSDKVYIPVKEFPEINFFGLLVGPRGNSLKKMERDSGAKISIRGKGSVKDGKVRPDMYAGDDDEDLHCFVTADNEDKVKKCVDLINSVIETAASTPETDNDHKRNQLRELAQLNGTLRDDEGQPCQNCGKIGHRKWDCPEQKNFTANIICHQCGGAGHMARDCLRRPGGPMQGVPGQQNGPSNQQTTPQFDSEYASLMAELGEAPKEGAAVPQPSAISMAPWRNPANWHPPSAPTNSGYGARNSYNSYGQQPQMGYGQGGGYAQAAY